MWLAGGCDKQRLAGVAAFLDGRIKY